MNDKEILDWINTHLVSIHRDNRERLFISIIWTDNQDSVHETRGFDIRDAVREAAAEAHEAMFKK